MRAIGEQDPPRCVSPTASPGKFVGCAPPDAPGDRVCHGDFHPGNVLLAEKGEVIIDWMDATCGNPLADVALSSIIALGVAETDQIPNAFLKTFVRLFHVLYLRHYFRLNPGDVREYRRWLPIVAAARLSEGIPELEACLVKQAKKNR